VQESVRALMGVTRVLGDYDDQMTPRGFRLVVDMIIDAYDSYFLSMDHQLRKARIKNGFLALIKNLSGSFGCARCH
jgi:hypothetical protein